MKEIKYFCDYCKSNITEQSFLQITNDFNHSDMCYDCFGECKKFLRQKLKGEKK